MSSSRNTKIKGDFRDMLGLLSKHGVQFVLVGGYALGAHDIPRFTKDIDFLVRPTRPNAQRLWKALTEFGAPLDQLSIDDFTIPSQFVQFGVDPNRIDFAMSISGVSFDEAWRDRVMGDFGDIQAPVLSREHLIRNKRASGRDSDLTDLKLLMKPPTPQKSRKPRARRRPRL